MLPRILKKESIEQLLLFYDFHVDVTDFVVYGFAKNRTILKTKQYFSSKEKMSDNTFR